MPPMPRDADPDKPVEDGMHPPTLPQLVHCIHCGEEYDSWRIKWRVFPTPNGGRRGFWCCPVPGCGGAGFGVDIFPVDFPEDGCWHDPDGRELRLILDEEDDEDEDTFDDTVEGDPPIDFLDGPHDRPFEDEDDIPF